MNYRHASLRASLALSTVALALAACGTGSSGSTSAAATAPGPGALTSAKGVTDITVWDGFGAANGVAFTKLVSQFNAEHRGKIHVTASFQGAYADLLAKYTAALRDRSGPTVLVAGDVATGYLTDVARSVPAAKMAAANPGDLDVADLTAASRNYYTVHGQLQAVPVATSTPVLWVNRDLLAKAGVPANADLSTLQNAVAVARTVAQRTGAKGWTMPDDDWYIEQLVASTGQNFCTPDNGRGSAAPTAITLNTGAAKSVITEVADLYRSKVALDGAPDGSSALTAFQAGKVALMPYSSGVLGALKQGTSFHYEALPFPTAAPKSVAGTIVGGSAAWLSRTASPAQQVAGWQFESYLASATAQEQFSHATGYVPINTAVGKSATQQAFLTANPNFRVFVNQIAATPVRPSTAGCVTGAMTTIRNDNINELQAAFNGSTSVSAALGQATSKAKTSLQQYRQQLGR